LENKSSSIILLFKNKNSIEKMIIRKNLKLSIIIAVSWKAVCWYALIGAICWGLYDLLGQSYLKIPFGVAGTLGTAFLRSTLGSKKNLGRYCQL